MQRRVATAPRRRRLCLDLLKHRRKLSAEMDELNLDTSFLVRDLVRGGDPILVSERSANRTTYSLLDFLSLTRCGSRGLATYEDLRWPFGRLLRVKQGTDLGFEA